MEYKESDFQIGDKIDHRMFGGGIIQGRRVEGDLLIWEIEFEDGETRSCTGIASQVVEVVKNPEAPHNLNVDIKMAVREAIDDLLGLTPVPLGERWLKGELVLIPGKKDTKEKRIPIESFLHKIVMLRDRLRVLEQQINSHPKLDDEDRVHLQQYITRIYGALTTFNVLFRNKDDYFVGEKSSDADDS